jgi:hypothetical protein
VGRAETRARRGRSRRDNMMNRENIYTEEKLSETERNHEQRNKVCLLLKRKQLRTYEDVLSDDVRN